jgi:Fe-S-cluster-containing dehydrogenase component
LPGWKNWQVTKTNGLWEDVVPRVDPELCRRCEDCPPVASCLASAFRRDGPGTVPYPDENVCFGCYSCAAACPFDAIILPRMPRRRKVKQDSP